MKCPMCLRGNVVPRLRTCDRCHVAVPQGTATDEQEGRPARRRGPLGYGPHRDAVHPMVDYVRTKEDR